MSLLSAIVNHFETSSAAEAVALRGLLGDRLLADVVVGDHPARPYCGVAELSTQRQSAARHGSRNSILMAVVVTFQVFAMNRGECETVLDAIEDCFLSNDAQLTITGRQHLGTEFSNRASLLDGAFGWRGFVELEFRVSKPGA